MNPELAATLTTEAAQVAYSQGKADGIWTGVIYTLGLLFGVALVLNLTPDLSNKKDDFS
jgi:hypothetical protein